MEHGSRFKRKRKSSSKQDIIEDLRKLNLEEEEQKSLIGNEGQMILDAQYQEPICAKVCDIDEADFDEDVSVNSSNNSTFIRSNSLSNNLHSNEEDKNDSTE